MMGYHAKCHRLVKSLIQGRKTQRIIVHHAYITWIIWPTNMPKPPPNLWTPRTALRTHLTATTRKHKGSGAHRGSANPWGRPNRPCGCQSPPSTLLTVNFRQPRHKFTFIVGIDLISKLMILTLMTYQVRIHMWFLEFIVYVGF
jgi:hypothetical protein